MGARRRYTREFEVEAVRLDSISPGRLVDNCFVRGFNGRLRDECLDIHHLLTLADVRTTVEHWRQGYDTGGPQRILRG